MGAVEITLMSFIALMTGLAGSCIVSFVLKRLSMSSARRGLDITGSE